MIKTLKKVCRDFAVYNLKKKHINVFMSSEISAHMPHLQIGLSDVKY